MGKPGPKPTPASQRFHAKYEVDAVSGCWNWTAHISTEGYGTIGETVEPGRSVSLYAHRVSYEMHKGPIPAGLVVDHMCNNTRCVNPEHLQAISHRENINRSPSPSVQRRLADRCIRGHDLSDPANVYVRRDGGGRQCKACIRLRSRNQARAAGVMPRKPPLPCGTYGACIGHYRRGEVPCDPCKAAHASYRREAKAKGKAKASHT